MTSQLGRERREQPLSDGRGVTITTWPRITGTAANGQTLTAVAPTTRGSAGTTLTRRWFRNNTVIAGQTGATLVLGPSDVGQRIRVEFRTVNSAFPSKIAVSPPTAVVV